MAKHVGSIDSFFEDVVYAEGSEYGEAGEKFEDIEEVLFESIDDIEKNGVPVEFVEQDGGGEGGGEYCYTILKIGNEYFKVEYNYYSHHGFDCDDADVYKVTPKEKTITVYE